MESITWTTANLMDKRNRTVRFGYTVEMGKQTLPSVPTEDYITFGRCFNCGGNGHVHNRCPLRQCRQCGKYGHVEKICKYVD